MNSLSIQTIGLILVLAYVVMCSAFILYQQQGISFVDSCDKALFWGCCISVIAFGVDAAAYGTMV